MDWIKHAFVAKFNRIDPKVHPLHDTCPAPPRAPFPAELALLNCALTARARGGDGPKVHNKFAAILCHDLSKCRSDNKSLDHTYLVAKRLGLVPLPLACVIVRLMSISTNNLNLKFNTAKGALLFFMLFLCLCALKVLLTILLMGNACNWTAGLKEPAAAAKHRKKLGALAKIGHYAQLQSK